MPMPMLDVSDDELNLLDTERLTLELIKADGDLSVVAEVILRDKRHKDRILAAISNDRVGMDSLAIKARAFVLVKMISTFAALQDHIITSMDDLKPDDLVKFYTKTAEVISSLSEVKTPSTTNPHEAALKSLPLEVRRAIEVVTMKPVNSNGNGADPSKGFKHIQPDESHAKSSIAAIEATVYDSDLTIDLDLSPGADADA